MIKINCEEAGHICDKSQYKEATLWEIVKLKLHHIYCKACLKHSKQNTKLTKLCNSQKLVVLGEDTKNLMKEAIKEQI